MGSGGFALPRGAMGNPLIKDSKLRPQLEPIPRLYDKDGEGRVRMLPKNSTNPADDTLIKRIGHSPDEADALVLACHALLHKRVPLTAGIR
jgi:hypothetical protein